MIRWNGKRYIPAGVKPLIRRRDGAPVPGKPNARWVAGWVGGLGEEPTPDITPTPTTTITNTPTPTNTPSATLPETCHIEAQNGDLLTAQNGDYIDHFPCIEPSPTPTITSSNTPTPTPSTPSVDPDAAAYLADVVASGGTTNPTIESAVDTLFTDLKSNGFYSKMKAMYPFVGATSGSHSINATLDKTFDIDWFGGVSHSISGSTGDGINGYGDTNFSPSLFTIPNESSFGSYMTITGNDGADGFFANYRAQLRYNINNEIRWGYGNGDPSIYNHGGSILNGNYGVIRTGNTESRLYHNGIHLDTQNNSNSNAASNHYIIFNLGGTSISFYGTYTLGFYYFINDITYSELQTLQNIINTFQTSLGRNTY